MLPVVGPAVETSAPLTRPSRSGAAWLAALWVVLHLQMVTLSGHFVTATDGPAFKPYHVALGLTLWWVVAKRWPIRVPLLPAVFVGALLFASTAAYASQGTFSPVLLNVVFALAAAVIGATLRGHLGAETFRLGLRAGSLVVTCLALAKAVAFRGAIAAFFLAPNGHPDLPSMVGGGLNLEATWVALGCAFWLGSGMLIPLVVASAALSAAFASRTGLLLAGAIAVAGMTTGDRPLRNLLCAMALLALVAGMALVLSQTVGGDVLSYVGRRFSSIGEEPGSLGRLALWQGGTRAFMAHPGGVGAGQGVAAAAQALGASFAEDNLHNLYLAQFVEGGLVGGVLFVVLAMVVWARVARRAPREPALTYVALYFVAALLQFRGGETIAWFLLGPALLADSPTSGT